MAANNDTSRVTMIQNLRTRVERMEAELRDLRLIQNLTSRVDRVEEELRELLNKLQLQSQPPQLHQNNEGLQSSDRRMASLEDNKFDYLLKIMLVGDSGVGKSSIMSRFTKNEFSVGYDPTVAVEFNITTRKVDGKTIKAQIWDTSGKNKYKDIRKAYLNGKFAALLVYDITRSQTFENLQMYLSEVREHTNADNILIIVGNKSDLNHLRAVSEKEAQSFAEKEGLLFLETSARESYNIEKVFHTILSDISHVISKKEFAVKGAVKFTQGR